MTRGFRPPPTPFPSFPTMGCICITGQVYVYAVVSMA